MKLLSITCMFTTPQLDILQEASHSSSKEGPQQVTERALQGPGTCQPQGKTKPLLTCAREGSESWGTLGGGGFIASCPTYPGSSARTEADQCRC